MRSSLAGDRKATASAAADALTSAGGMRPTTTRILILVVAVAALAVLTFVTGWTDDKAPPGTGGRAPVTDTAPDDSR
jgi:hypothetical protein